MNGNRRILESLKQDLAEAFPEIVVDPGISVWDILNAIFQKTKERFSDYFGFTEEEVDHLFDIYLKTTKKPKIIRLPQSFVDWGNSRSSARDF